MGNKLVGPMAKLITLWKTFIDAVWSQYDENLGPQDVCFTEVFSILKSIDL